MAVDLSTEKWLSQLPTAMDKYAATLQQHGFGNIFAVGLLDEEGIYGFGIWEKDAKYIGKYLSGPRQVTARLTPLIGLVPTMVAARVWLSKLPVNLSHHWNTLQAAGYDAVGALRHINAEDARELGLPEGHCLVLHHCAIAMGNLDQSPPDCSLPLEEWLMQLNPPLLKYSKAIRLLGIDKVTDLFQLTRSRIESEAIIKMGHRRVLWYYIVAARTHWYDIL